MKRTFFSKKIFLILLIVIAVIAIGFFFFSSNTTNEDWVTTTVERGDVQDIVSVSGFVEAKNTADLSFPVTGIVTDVFTAEGAEVIQGDLLATLGSANLVAQRSDAVAMLRKAQAARDELIIGATAEVRAVSETTVITAATHLMNTSLIEAEKVTNAKALLLSTGLEIRSENNEESAGAPILTGTYTCEEEGLYILNVYNSSSYAGYSYELSGLETGIENASTRQPSTLGECGLYLQFTDGDSYSNSEWIIEIPNTKGSSYVSYKNAYDLALQQKTQSVQAAQDALDLASDNRTLTNAPPSNAALQQVNASVQSAQARISQIDAQIKDMSIVAPFDGVITDVDVRPGETAGPTPVITILAQGAFELKARIPEIDITKIISGQHATVVFDAQSNETLTGTLTFVSPLATEIDGVAYFNTTIALDQTPVWIRSGLNADIDIIVEETANALRVPKRYLIRNTDGTISILVPSQNDSVTVPIKILSTGNNGYVAITGLNEGDTIIAP